MVLSNEEAAFKILRISINTRYDGMSCNKYNLLESNNELVDQDLGLASGSTVGTSVLIWTNLMSLVPVLASSVLNF